jgi:DNA-binding CsgD family transcriptional regulator/PAS domain-containing protein
VRSLSLTRIIPSIFDAALAPELWPAALESIVGAVGAVGAAYIIREKRTGRVDWISLSGPTLELKADYLTHYSGLDPYWPVLDAAPSGTLVRLSDCLPETVLRRDEWYNDFILKSGIGDILGAPLFDSGSHTAVFGIHRGVGLAPFASLPAAPIQELFAVLSKAARLHQKLRSLDWKSSVTLRALDRLAAGVIVTDGDRRVIEMNHAAERMVRLADGLMIRNNQVCARRAFEDTKLARSIAACAGEKSGQVAGRMLIGRHSDRPAYILTVAPLSPHLGIYDRPLAMVVIVDPEDLSPSERDLADLLGLSPAESRLAAALMTGKKLSEIATDFGLQITTLRTQLSSILRKVGVERQADLARVLSSIGVAR